MTFKDLHSPIQQGLFIDHTLLGGGVREGTGQGTISEFSPPTSLARKPTQPHHLPRSTLSLQARLYPESYAGETQARTVSSARLRYPAGTGISISCSPTALPLLTS